MVKPREILLSFIRAYQRPLRCVLIIMLIGFIWIGIRVAFGWMAGPVCLSPSCSQVVTVNIDRGSTLPQIGQILAEKKVIRSGRLFVYYGRITGQDKKMQAGTYRISNTWSMQEVAECISSGKVTSCRLVIPEGYTVAQIEDLLVQKGIADRELFRKALETDYSFSFLEGISETGPERLEGFLFPATYELHLEISEEEIIKMMLQRFQIAFTPEMQQQAERTGLSVRDVVTLASLVEREAEMEEERPQIAAVFLNRLHKGLRLESCATVQYILGQQKEMLTNTDLQIASPYNTYLCTGLPPGPIANPGLSSIKAVLHPADVDYLFFVAKGDGSHHFSNTFKEHQEVARYYQSQR